MKLFKIMIALFLAVATAQSIQATSGVVVTDGPYGGGVAVGVNTGVYPYGSWCYNNPYSAGCGYGYGYAAPVYGGYFGGGYGRGYRGGYYRGGYRGGYGHGGGRGRR